MANSKISALTSATTPLAGTETLPIVQSSATKQVSVANLTVGRSVSMADATLTTGNLVIGTSGKGIDFSATPGTGTSELLADYEEGTWTPADASGSSLSFTVTSATYTKIGRIVNLIAYFTYPATASANPVLISGLPFTQATNTYAPAILDTNAGIIAYIRAVTSTSMDIRLVNGATQVLNATMSTRYVIFSMTYQT